METFVLPNIYGIVWNADRTAILLQTRWKPETDPVNTGKLELPGGKWRAWESAEDCLRREIVEETGLQLISVESGSRTYAPKDGQSVQVVEPMMTVQMLDGAYPSVLTVLMATADGTPVANGDGSRDCSWVEIAEVVRLVEETPERITALTLAALRRALERGMLSSQVAG